MILFMADRKKGKTVLFEESPELHLTPQSRKPNGKQSRFISELMEHDLTVSPPNNDRQSSGAITAYQGARLPEDISRVSCQALTICVPSKGWRHTCGVAVPVG